MLESFLRQEEGKTLEFKENAKSLYRIMQTIVAFANTAGGTLVIGIRDKTKDVVGIGDVLKEEERIANALADSITPLIVPNFQFYTWRKRDLMIITVAHSHGPYYLKAKGKDKSVYIRFGSTNRVADQATIFEIQRIALHQSFDELPHMQASVNDIDFEQAKTLFSNVEKNFNRNTARSIELLVKHQNKEYPSNAALLLFGKNRKKFFPNALVRCGLFAGTSKSKILDQQDIDRPLPLAIEAVITFIERHTSTRSEIGRLERVDIPQYPPVVVREAVTNAILHADYSIKGANIQVALFRDRIEITNPGALPFGLSLEQALSGISQLRNRVIAHVFRELNLIERWGSGLGRMIENCTDLGIKEPVFEEHDHFFRVTLYHDVLVETPKSPWQQIILEYLETHQKVITKNAAKLWQVTERTASSRLKKMCNMGMIVEVSTSPYDPKKHFVLSSHHINTSR